MTDSKRIYKVTEFAALKGCTPEEIETAIHRGLLTAKDKLVAPLVVYDVLALNFKKEYLTSAADRYRKGKFARRIYGWKIYKITDELFRAVHDENLTPFMDYTYDGIVDKCRLKSPDMKRLRNTGKGGGKYVYITYSEQRLLLKNLPNLSEFQHLIKKLTFPRKE